jgi:outer membrane protein insertion porin family
MLLARQVTLFSCFRWITCGVLALSLIASCTVPSKVQPGKPFVYKTNINISGNVPEKLQLKERLENQLDDSLKTRLVSYAGVYREIVRPPVFDTANIGRSKVFMTSLLNSLGYYYPAISDTFRIDTVREKVTWQRFWHPRRYPKRGYWYRAFINMTVNPGIVLRFDSIGYALATPELQQLVLKNRDKSVLKKNEPYTLQSVSDELDRLLVIFRNSGYYKMNKEHLFAEVDTVVAALIDPTLDPFEQVRLLDSLQKKRQNPTINIIIRQHPIEDGNQIKKFYIGDVTVFPDASFTEEYELAKKDTTLLRGYKFIYSSRRFKLPFIAKNIRLVPGSQYVQRRYFRTINNLTSLGAWSNVDVELQERYDSVPLLDAFVRLYPAPKMNLNVSFETSRNVSDFLTTGQLFGIGVNGRLLNRNAYREAIQTVSSARFGIELGKNIVQTLQVGLAHSINFPKFISPIRINTDSLINPRTQLNLNAAYTDRFQFFQSRSFNASWGYEWTKGRRRDDQDQPGQRWRKTWQYIPLNFEFTNVIKEDSLKKLEDTITAYKFAFNDGLIMSQILSMSTGFEKDNKVFLFRTKLEESGALFGMIKKLELGDLRRFIKVDGEIRHFINHKKSQWAFRAYAGYGYVYGKTDTGGTAPPEERIVNENTLPFFKAFFAGGPYSMRAWQIRRLGPGSSTIYQPTDTSTAIERFGNMQLELNAEYRFNITTIAGIKVNSAFFVDIGNIWSKEFKVNQTTGKLEVDPTASFTLSRLGKDIAIGAGTSLRFDFDFFLIRLDWAYKIKDPLYSYKNDGWFNDIRLLNGQFQLGIGHPF